MIPLHELKNMPEAKKLGHLLLFVGLVWLLGFVLLSDALYILRHSKERLGEADSILNAATMIKSYPSHKTPEGKEPLSAISSVIDSLGLKERVAQMNSGASGLTLQVERLYPEEFTNLVESISINGLYIKTAEIRAISSGKDGRLLNVTFAIGGEE